MKLNNKDSPQVKDESYGFQGKKIQGHNSLIAKMVNVA